MTYQHFPLGGFLMALLDGWQLPFVVEPAMGNHGNYAITLWKESQ